jgi:hypothetical protein
MRNQLRPKGAIAVALKVQLMWAINRQKLLATRPFALVERLWAPSTLH